MEKTRKRNWDSRFSGVRFNVESVPRLPTFPVRWALDDPRQRAYLLIWTSPDGSLAYLLRIAPVDQGAGVTLRTPEGRTRRISVIRPSGTGTSLFYCWKPRRFLYGHSVSGRGLVDYRAAAAPAARHADAPP